jgi:uncharacterized protein (TIGR04255 family)
VHPTFPNPTIVEAVCEIRFVQGEAKPWNPNIVGQFFLKVNNDFPNMEPLQTMGVELQVGPTGFGHKIVPTAMKTRFRNSDGSKLISLGEGAVGANILRPYSGWDSMKSHMRFTWNTVRDLVEPKAITRVGLRYINAIPLSDIDEPVSAWLTDNDYLPKSVVRSYRGILFRSDFQVDAKNRMIVQLADASPDDRFQKGSIVFDIDRIVEAEDSDTGVSHALDLAEQLHDDVWSVFSSSLSGQYKRHLEKTS